MCMRVCGLCIWTVRGVYAGRRLLESFVMMYMCVCVWKQVQEGIVVAVGQGGIARQTGQLIPMSIKVNDKVLLPEFGGQVCLESDLFGEIVHEQIPRSSMLVLYKTGESCRDRERKRKMYSFVMNRDLRCVMMMTRWTETLSLFLCLSVFCVSMKDGLMRILRVRALCHSLLIY